MYLQKIAKVKSSNIVAFLHHEVGLIKLDNDSDIIVYARILISHLTYIIVFLCNKLKTKVNFRRAQAHRCYNRMEQANKCWFYDYKVHFNVKFENIVAEH